MSNIYKSLTVLLTVLSTILPACAEQPIVCTPQFAHYTDQEIQQQIAKMALAADAIALDAGKNKKPNRQSKALDAKLQLEMASADTDPKDRRADFTEAYKLLLSAQQTED